MGKKARTAPDGPLTRGREEPSGLAEAAIRREAPESVIVSFGELAHLVAHAVARELAAEAEEQCGGAQAIVEWVAERANEDADLEALAALVGGLAADTLAAVTLGRAA